jgi:hypothetical protein
VLAEALVVTPKKENANITVQMNPTKNLLRSNVLPIIHISISKFVSAFLCFMCQTSLCSRDAPAYRGDKQAITVCIQVTFTNTNSIQRWLLGSG